MPQNKSIRLRQALRLLGCTLALGLLLAALVLGVTGDYGLTQRWLNGVEQRALASRSTLPDRLGLRLLYGGGQLAGRMAYPQAARLLRHYLQGSGDTLRFDARPLLQNPDVQQALRQHKPGITFRHQSSAHNPFYVVPKTNWPLYYAFDLLYIKQEKGQVVFYDKYFFQPIARRSRTRFQLGKISFLLNDGLLSVAYPQARAFVVVGRAGGTP